MALRKPKLNPYEIRCDLCWKRNVLIVFTTYAEYEAHLKSHWR